MIAMDASFRAPMQDKLFRDYPNNAVAIYIDGSGKTDKSRGCDYSSSCQSSLLSIVYKATLM